MSSKFHPQDPKLVKMIGIKEEKLVQPVMLQNAHLTDQLSRLVLASCSSFLSSVFLTLPEGLPEFTFIVPNIKKDVLNTFIEFLYTVSTNGLIPASDDVTETPFSFHRVKCRCTATTRTTCSSSSTSSK